MPLNPLSPPMLPTVAQPPRFGLNLASVDGLLSWVQKSRTREMIVEDLGGFGVARTGMDLGREYFYRQDGQIAGQPSLNIPAARERAIREILSVLTDNVSGGVLAYGIASMVNASRGQKNMANTFVSKETLLLFQEVAQGSRSEAEFLQKLAGRIAPPGHQGFVAQQLAKAVTAAKTKGKVCEATCEDVAVAIAKQIQNKERCFDRAISLSPKSAKALGQANPKTWFSLEALAEDASHLTQAVGKTKPGQWQPQAKALLAETIKVNRFRLPVSLGLAMGLTMAVPFLNRHITRKLDGTDMYPGEIGLRTGNSWENPNKPNWWAHNFPYLTESFQKGHMGALLLSLLPLPFAFGLIDCHKLPSALSEWNLKQAINLPGKGFGNRLATMLQFGKKFPFTTPQQIAACFAFLIFSRLITTRSEIEFRERLVDSFGGLLMWQLVTPMAKHFFAKRQDAPNLLKTIDGHQVMRSRTEVQRLVESGLSSSKQVAGHLQKLGTSSPLGKYVALSSASLGISLFVLGILEPFIAIKWTERQVREQNRREPNPFQTGQNAPGVFVL